MDKTENEDTQQVLRPIIEVPSHHPELIDYVVSNQILPAKHYNHDDAIIYSHHREKRARLNEIKKTRVFVFGVKESKKSEPLCTLDRLR